MKQRKKIFYTAEQRSMMWDYYQRGVRSTVSREISRNGGRRKYRASRADTDAWERAKRPKDSKSSIK